MYKKVARLKPVILEYLLIGRIVLPVTSHHDRTADENFTVFCNLD
jgi:hypothetical protein